ncbi:unnamed protein product [Alopecurus aequalis]
MPSWPNSGTSSDDDCRLTGLSSGSLDGGYTPDSIEDASFGGIAIDSTELCRVHKQLPARFVAFEGTNTGRRFLACAIKNEVDNCGFVSWIDPEWPSTLENALCSLWSKMEETNAARIDEKIDHALMVQNLSADKVKVEKKYNSLIAEVNKLLEDTAANVRKENLEKMRLDDGELALSQFARMELEEQWGQVVKDRDHLKLQLEKVTKENSKLAEENIALKHDSEMMKIVQKKREEERVEMKEEKKKLEYMLYDMLKANNGLLCHLLADLLLLGQQMIFLQVELKEGPSLQVELEEGLSLQVELEEGLSLHTFFQAVQQELGLPL